MTLVKSGEKSTSVGESEERFESDEELPDSDGVTMPAASFLVVSNCWPVLGFLSIKAAQQWYPKPDQVEREFFEESPNIVQKIGQVALH